MKGLEMRVGIKILAIALIVIQLSILNSCSSAKEASGTEQGPTPQNSPPPTSQSAALPVPEVLNITAAGTGCPGGEKIAVAKKTATGEIEVSMPELRAEADPEAGVSLSRSSCALSFEAAATSPSPVRLELIEATLEVEPELVTEAKSVANAEVFQAGLRGESLETEIHDPSLRGVQVLRTKDLLLSAECGQPLSVRANASVFVKDGTGAIQATRLRLKFRETRCN